MLLHVDVVLVSIEDAQWLVDLAEIKHQYVSMLLEKPELADTSRFIAALRRQLSKSKHS